MAENGPPTRSMQTTMNEFFTSDEHYYHKNIIKYCNRPFEHAEQMNEAMIGLHNATVPKDGVVWHIGDFSMLNKNREDLIEKVLSRLNGTHHLILGNHDRLNPNAYVDLGFTSVHTAMWFVSKGGTSFVMAHDPSTYTVVEYDKDKPYLLCGHVHGLFKHLLPEKRIINVGVDAWEYKPVSIADILKLVYPNVETKK